MDQPSRAKNERKSLPKQSVLNFFTVRGEKVRVRREDKWPCECRPVTQTTCLSGILF